MISSFETQRRVWTLCLLLFGAVSCCSGLTHQQTDKTADQMRSATKVTKQQKTAALDLGALMDAGEGAMVTLVAGETRMAVHRAVLEAMSPVLTAMLRPVSPEACSGEVVALDVEGPVLRQLAAFLYTGKAPQMPGMALPLLAAAKMYGLPGLSDICEQLVADQLSVENVAATAVIAVRHNYFSLRKAAVCFIKQHLEVMTTKGWAYAVHNHPGEVVEFTRLLADTCEAATTDSSPAATATAPTATPTAATTTAAITAATTAATTAAPTTATHNAANTTTTTVATTVATTAATTTATTTATVPPTAPTPDPTAVSSCQGLSDDEKGRRLREAAQWGALEEMRVLLAAGAEVDHRNSWGYTALYWAAATHRPAVLRLLVAAGADLDASIHAGWTSLHYAANYGDAEAAATLLEAGADTEARNDEGQTPLALARLTKKQHLVQLLQ